jgi:hypothetical protein
MRKLTEELTMKNKSSRLTVVAALAFASVSSVTTAETEECDGVLVQSRFALANCMIESAVAVAAAAATENGCVAGEWDIEAVVPELISGLIPLQGTTTISGNGDFVELTGQSSALAQNNINCRVATTSSGNVFDGKALTYSPGFDNYYVDAIIDRDSNMLCISESLSSGDIELDDEDFDESNSLTFQEEDGLIEAEGMIIIGASQGQGGSGQGQGPGGPEPEDLSIWDVEEEVLIPDVNQTALEGFELEAETDDIGLGCEIEVAADVQNLASWIVEGETGGLTISGKLFIEVADDD